MSARPVVPQLSAAGVRFLIDNFGTTDLAPMDLFFRSQPSLNKLLQPLIEIQQEICSCPFAGRTGEVNATRRGCEPAGIIRATVVQFCDPLSITLAALRLYGLRLYSCGPEGVPGITDSLGINPFPLKHSHDLRLRIIHRIHLVVSVVGLGVGVERRFSPKKLICLSAKSSPLAIRDSATITLPLI